MFLDGPSIAPPHLGQDQGQRSRSNGAIPVAGMLASLALQIFLSYSVLPISDCRSQ